LRRRSVPQSRGRSVVRFWQQPPYSFNLGKDVFWELRIQHPA
jgi:hypothetical protein